MNAYINKQQQRKYTYTIYNIKKMKLWVLLDYAGATVYSLIHYKVFVLLSFGKWSVI